ncbi:MAG: AAA family ATPase [Candidatus Gorgyraea atricola]|nr:AAA family ATPase [Candidatus Gorgyraea atricola]
MIIGLTGPNASGKGEAARYIESKGFVYHSLSDILRDEAKRLSIEPLRENLIKLGNKLRRKNKASFLAEETIKKLAPAQNHIVDSIRNPAEVEALKRLDDFILVGVNAPVEMRFKRGIDRKRPGDAQTLDDFIEKEKKENKNDPRNQQLKKCLQLVDALIINDSTLEKFYKKIDETIKKYKKT